MGSEEQAQIQKLKLAMSGLASGQSEHFSLPIIDKNDFKVP